MRVDLVRSEGEEEVLALEVGNEDELEGSVLVHLVVDALYDITHLARWDLFALLGGLCHLCHCKEQQEKQEIGPSFKFHLK
jgi:hypothetical protein